MITETEELDIGPVMPCVQETMETVEETKEGSSGETVEESMEETKVRNLHVKPWTPFALTTQKSHIKRMYEWLLPYLIVMILIIGMEGAVVLVSYSRTQQLSKQLQEQYGEYFADE